MKVDVVNRGDGSFTVSLDDAEFTLSGQDVKSLMVQLTQALAPDSAVARETQLRNRRFIKRVNEAEDVDLQVFIQVADHDDIVILLKATEHDNEVRQKLFRNMSETLRKIFLEDMEFRFKDDAPDAQISAALGRLMQTADELREEDRTDF